jgi:hypothetical protein
MAKGYIQDAGNRSNAVLNVIFFNSLQVGFIQEVLLNQGDLASGQSWYGLNYPAMSQTGYACTLSPFDFRPYTIAMALL